MSPRPRSCWASCCQEGVCGQEPKPTRFMVPNVAGSQEAGLCFSMEQDLHFLNSTRKYPRLFRNGPWDFPQGLFTEEKWQLPGYITSDSLGAIPLSQREAGLAGRS